MINIHIVILILLAGDKLIFDFEFRLIEIDRKWNLLKVSGIKRDNRMSKLKIVCL